jgi:hypothetical protein
MIENVFSVESDPMLYNENPMPTESELSNSLEISGEDD